VQFTVTKASGQRKRGYNVRSRACYTKEQFLGSKDSVAVIAAVTYDHVLPCSLVLPPGMTTSGLVFETWFTVDLLPCIAHRGYTALLDNAAYHRRPILRAACHLAGVNLVFLPKYSPELAPIELCFGWVRKILQHVNGTMQQASTTVLATLLDIPFDTVQNFWTYCGYSL
jgi:DDE superfamily endonuclease